MNLKGLLPQDVDYINRWQADLVFRHGLGERELSLVRCSILRILANEIRAQYRRKMADGWWDPAPREHELSHVVDWLRADLKAGAPWLERRDEQGRPRKLLKCSTISDLMREADKAMNRRNGGAMASSLGPEDEEHVADLGGGYAIVRLLTPEALDLESSRIHHCVGHGSYDGKVKSGWGRFLSVRDRKRRPVATIELAREGNGRWSIRQIQGKHNERPTREVMDAIRPYAVERQWRDREYWWPTVTAEGGIVYHVDRIPAGTMVQGGLDASAAIINMLGVFELPADLTVLGNLIMSPKLRIPERLTVCGFLEIERYSIVIDDDYEGVFLPESLHVDREIRVPSRGDIARPIPTHLYPIIKVHQRKLSGTRLESLQWVETEEGMHDDEEPSMGI